MRFDDWWKKYWEKHGDHGDFYIYEKDVRAAYCYGTNKYAKQLAEKEKTIKKLRECLKFYCVEHNNHWQILDDLMGGVGVGGKRARQCLADLNKEK
jgi:hypothetical protein